MDSKKAGNGETQGNLSDWSDIHFAYQVARLGTLSAAAAELDVHHSTVLRRVDALERKLKTRLFHRHARGYSPTEAGKVLLEVASRTQDEFDRMSGRLLGADQQLTGTLVITTMNGFSARLTPLLAKFQQQHPQIRIEYVSEDRLFKLEHGEAHVSLRAGEKPKDLDYVVQRLSTTNDTLFASSAYVKRYGKMRNLQDIDGHRFISTVRKLNNIKPVKWIFDHVPEEQIYYRTSDFLSMRIAAEAGLGIAPVNDYLGRNNKFLTPMFAAPKDWESSLWLVTHRDIHHTPKVQAITQFLKKHLTSTKRQALEERK